VELELIFAAETDALAAKPSIADRCVWRDQRGQSFDEMQLGLSSR